MTKRLILLAALVVAISVLPALAEQSKQPNSHFVDL